MGASACTGITPAGRIRGGAAILPPATAIIPPLVTVPPVVIVPPARAVPPVVIVANAPLHSVAAARDSARCAEKTLVSFGLRASGMGLTRFGVRAIDYVYTENVAGKKSPPLRFTVVHLFRFPSSG